MIDEKIQDWIVLIDVETPIVTAKITLNKKKELFLKVRNYMLRLHRTILETTK